jgi:L-ribulokinase
MIFKALVEATAFGAKRIIDRFREEGVEINQVTAIGGIPLKSPFVMQTCANVFNMPIRVSESDQTCALGAAMFAAVVSGIYENVEQAMTNMKPAYKAEYLPECDKVAFYQKKYLRYCRLSEIMENEIMSNLP